MFERRGTQIDHFIVIVIFIFTVELPGQIQPLGPQGFQILGIDFLIRLAPGFERLFFGLRGFCSSG